MVLSGHIDKANKMLEKDIENGSIENSGEVYLVGSGPGDPELLTFRALRLMQKADVVIYDRLVSDPIMNLLRKDSEKIYVEKQIKHIENQYDYRKNKFGKERLEYILKFTSKYPQELSVMDIGCGAGYFIDYIKKQLEKITMNMTCLNIYFQSSAKIER